MAELSRRKKIFFSLILVVLVLGAVEILARVGLFLVQGTWFSTDRSRQERAEIATAAPHQQRPGRGAVDGSPRGSHWMVLHPFVGFVADAETDVVAVDSQGFINREGWRLEESDVSVAVLGGSVARGLALRGQRALIAELSKAPSLSGRTIAVRNLALGGYKQPQQLMILNYLMTLGERFDIVINLDGFNEVAIPFRDNVPSGVSPFYPRSWPFWVGRTQDLSTQRLVGTIALLQDRQARLAALYTAPFDYSAFCEIIWRFLDGRLARDIFAAREELLAEGAARRSFRTHGPKRPWTGPDELFADLAEYWRRTSLLMHQLSSSNGIRYFHFLQPNQYVPGSKPIGKEEEKVAISPRAKYRYRTAVEKGYPELVAASEKLVAAGVSFYDLRMIYADRPEPLYVDTCCHVNQVGNTIMAREIGRRIVDELAAVPAEG